MQLYNHSFHTRNLEYIPVELCEPMKKLSQTLGLAFSDMFKRFDTSYKNPLGRICERD